jgi:glutathione S-transferase
MTMRDGRHQAFELAPGTWLRHDGGDRSQEETPAMTPTIHGMLDSGNCYKPRLLMALTGRPFRHSEVSTRDGSTRTAAFLARNPAGQCPLLELEDGRVLAESDAILVYLGEGTPFARDEPFERA